jgi:hypothetical protein
MIARVSYRYHPKVTKTITSNCGVVIESELDRPRLMAHLLEDEEVLVDLGPQQVAEA